MACTAYTSANQPKQPGTKQIFISQVWGKHGHTKGTVREPSKTLDLLLWIPLELGPTNLGDGKRTTHLYTFKWWFLASYGILRISLVPPSLTTNLPITFPSPSHPPHMFRFARRQKRRLLDSRRPPLPPGDDVGDSFSPAQIPEVYPGYCLINLGTNHQHSPSHMRTMVLVDLPNKTGWFGTFGQMLVCIFQHHGLPWWASKNWRRHQWRFPGNCHPLALTLRHPNRSCDTGATAAAATDRSIELPRDPCSGCSMIFWPNEEVCTWKINIWNLEYIKYTSQILNIMFIPHIMEALFKTKHQRPILLHVAWHTNYITIRSWYG
jgi:hypothetical protein